MLAIALLVSLTSVAEAASTSPYAPPRREGPPLRVDPQKLANSLTCSPGVVGATTEPVLLVAATGVNSDQNFSWNYEPLFNQKGIPWCASDQPGPRNSNLTDIQVRGQYLTYAIRKMHEMAGRPIGILGHSQGGMAMRWSLRFWPDTRPMVDDVIGMAATNHGTTRANDCPDGSCTFAQHQQAANSNFIAALNSRKETFPSISYTEIATSLDEVATPQPAASSVSGPGRITNVLIQDVCPLAVSEHLNIGTIDPTAAALVLDALSHDGPADPKRINPLVCLSLFQPGVDPINGPGKALAGLQSILANDGPKGPEPKLRCYVFKNGHECRQARQDARAG